MPTPAQAYAAAAAKFGKVDPQDTAAVEHFFVHEFRKLSERKQRLIIEFLMQHEGTASVAQAVHPKQKRQPKGLPPPDLTTVVLPTAHELVRSGGEPRKANRPAVFSVEKLSRSYEPVAKIPRRLASPRKTA